MTPDLPIQLAGLRRVLLEVVAPAVPEPFAAAQLASVCEALSMLAARWPREPGLLALESRELRQLFAELGPALADARARAVGPELPERLAGAAAAAGSALDGGREEPTLRSAHLALRALLCDAIAALKRHPDPELREALRARIRGVLARALERRFQAPR